LTFLSVIFGLGLDHLRRQKEWIRAQHKETVAQNKTIVISRRRQLQRESSGGNSGKVFAVHRFFTVHSTAECTCFPICCDRVSTWWPVLGALQQRKNDEESRAKKEGTSYTSRCRNSLSFTLYHKHSLRRQCQEAFAWRHGIVCNKMMQIAKGEFAQFLQPSQKSSSLSDTD